MRNRIKQESQTKLDLFIIDFIDEKIGWAARAEEIILHTNDGGQTWLNQSTGTSVFQIPHTPGPWATAEPFSVIGLNFFDGFINSISDMKPSLIENLVNRGRQITRL